MENKPLILNNLERVAARDAMNTIQQKAFVLRSLGFEVDDTFEEMFKVERTLICSD